MDMDYLQSHGGAVSAIAAVVGVTVALAALFLNLFSVWLARQLAQENRRLRQAQSNPQVVVYARPDLRYSNILNLVIENIGQGPALDIQVSHDITAEEAKAHSIRDGFFKAFKRISILPAGAHVKFWISTGVNLAKPEPLRPITFDVVCTNLAGEGRSFRSAVDVTEFYGWGRLGADTGDEIVKHMGRIDDRLRGIERSAQKLAKG
jgi:hypothetical protein